MTIFDIKVCPECNKVTFVSGSYGVTEIKKGDIINPIETDDEPCEECKENEKN